MPPKKQQGSAGKKDGNKAGKKSTSTSNASNKKAQQKKEKEEKKKEQKVKKYISDGAKDDQINRIELKKKLREVVRQRKLDPKYTVEDGFASVVSPTEEAKARELKGAYSKNSRLLLKQKKAEKEEEAEKKQKAQQALLKNPKLKQVTKTNANNNNNNNQNKAKKEGETPLPPSYYLSGKTLLLGDGDFSFAASLLLHRKDHHNIIATSYDTLVQVKSKYEDTIEKHFDFIKQRNTLIMHGIDATKLIKYFPNQYTTHNPLQYCHYPTDVVQDAQDAQLAQDVKSAEALAAMSQEERDDYELQLAEKRAAFVASGQQLDILPTAPQQYIHMRYPFDKILFNFPHSGEQRVHINRTLLRDFFVSARPHLSLPLELSYPYNSSKTCTQQRQKLDALLDTPTPEAMQKLLAHIKQVRARYMKLQPNASVGKKNLAKDKDSHKVDHFGRVLVVLRDGEPYRSWDIDVQAAGGLYELEAKLDWEPECWKFYHHKTTDVTHNELTAGKAHIYVYRLTDLGVAMAMKEQATIIYQQQEDKLLQYYQDAKKYHPTVYGQYRGALELLMNISPTMRTNILKRQRKLAHAKGEDEEEEKILVNEPTTMTDAGGAETTATTAPAEKVQLDAKTLSSRLNDLFDEEEESADNKKKDKKNKKQKVEEAVSKDSKALLDQLVQLPPPASDAKNKKGVKDTAELMKNVDLSSFMSLIPADPTPAAATTAANKKRDARAMDDEDDMEEEDDDALFDFAEGEDDDDLEFLRQMAALEGEDLYDILGEGEEGDEMGFDVLNEVEDEDDEMVDEDSDDDDDGDDEEQTTMDDDIDDAELFDNAQDDGAIGELLHDKESNEILQTNLKDLDFSNSDDLALSYELFGLLTGQDMSKQLKQAKKQQQQKEATTKKTPTPQPVVTEKKNNNKKQAPQPAAAEPTPVVTETKSKGKKTAPVAAPVVEEVKPTPSAAEKKNNKKTAEPPVAQEKPAKKTTKEPTPPTPTPAPVAKKQAKNKK